MELARGVRSQLEGLVSGLAGTDLTPMSLGLSHSLSRYKLKFSPDKVRPACTVADPLTSVVLVHGSSFSLYCVNRSTASWMGLKSHVDTPSYRLGFPLIYGETLLLLEFLSALFHLGCVVCVTHSRFYGGWWPSG